MLYFLPGPILGIFFSILLLLGTFSVAVAAFTLGPIFYLLPKCKIKTRLGKLLHQIPDYWSIVVQQIFNLGKPITWDIRGLQNFSTNEWYVLISNHQSWVDILILQAIFSRKTSPIRFFMKKQLQWQLPIISQACMILNYPFMKRYSKEYLAKHPELKGKDIETTKIACEKFKNIPTTMINFVEGGRFTKEKHKKQNSPYQYLLKPRPRGTAFILQTMGEYLHKFIDVTVVYSGDHLSLWNVLCGRVKKVTIDIKSFPIEPKLLGDYDNDSEFNAFFQQWLNDLWREKDKCIADIKAQEKIVIDTHN